MTTSPQWLEPPQLTKTFSPAILFVEALPVTRGLPAFVVSLLLHAAVISVLFLAFHAPHGRAPQRIPRRYTVQFIRLQPPPVRQALAAPVLAARSSHDGMKAASSESQAFGPADIHRRFKLPVSSKFSPARQTLVQLDAPPKLVMNEIAVPDLLLWSPREAPPPRKRLIPPPPRDVPKPAQNVLAPPKLDVPNQEIKIADLRFSAPPVSELPKLAAPPATTSPLKIQGPEEGAQLPQTVSTSSSQQTAAHIISLSNLPLHADSVVAVLPANQIAASGGNEGNGAGQAGGASESAAGRETGSAASEAKGTGAGAEGNALATDATGNATQGLARSSGPGGFGSSHSGVRDELNMAAIHKLTLPKDGKFGVVVLGSSASEAYPDSVGLMTGKVIYTVYLKVGLRKNWILQYCLPGAIEQTFSAKGSATPLDPPWPFLMLRPDLPTGSGADALMVRGFVNVEGRFEKLALVLPGGFPQKELLLASLRKWEFRPAKRDQQPIAVEVLLIIPGEAE
jgi:hypothetical protein